MSILNSYFIQILLADEMQKSSGNCLEEYLNSQWLIDWLVKLLIDKWWRILQWIRQGYSKEHPFTVF